MTWIDDDGEDTESYRQSIAVSHAKHELGGTHYKSQDNESASQLC